MKSSVIIWLTFSFSIWLPFSFKTDYDSPGPPSAHELLNIIRFVCLWSEGKSLPTTNKFKSLTTCCWSTADTALLLLLPTFCGIGWPGEKPFDIFTNQKKEIYLQSNLMTYPHLFLFFPLFFLQHTTPTPCRKKQIPKTNPNRHPCLSLSLSLS